MNTLNIRDCSTRRGKIARLPHAIREELNLRLRNGQEGQKLILWLNALPEVQEILAAQFNGKPILENNLSHWKHGGYVDWLAQAGAEMTPKAVLDLSQESVATVQARLSDKLAVMLSNHIIAEIERLPLTADTADRVRQWRELRLAVASLKRYEHFAREENRADAQEREAKRLEAKKNNPRTREQTRREVARILGIDPDGPRINPETDLFEGPNAEALNIQRARVKKEIAEREARENEFLRAELREAEPHQSQPQITPNQPPGDPA